MGEGNESGATEGRPGPPDSASGTAGAGGVEIAARRGDDQTRGAPVRPAAQLLKRGCPEAVAWWRAAIVVGDERYV